MTSRRIACRGSLALLLIGGLSVVPAVAEEAADARKVAEVARSGGVLSATSMWRLFTAAANADPVVVNSERVADGRELFEHEWSARDTMSPMGDGLGPLHNERSCVACHNQGGVGGAGPADKNVDLISADVPGARGEKGRKRREKAARELSMLHPSFVDNKGELIGTMVLHRFGDAEYGDWRYRFLAGEFFADELEEGETTSKRKLPLRDRVGKGREPVSELGSIQDITFHLSQRNTPALFGAGLIDSISAETVRNVAMESRKKFPGISGRMPISNEGGFGRFGWRGQTATLEDFVLTACANELGLAVKDHNQPKSPLSPHYRLDGVDMDHEQCKSLVSYVASLPAPRQIEPADSQERLVLKNGEALFNSVGCSACHVKNLGEVTGIYSNLLLHDMGDYLSDPVNARPETRTKVISKGGGGYSGGSSFAEEFVPPTSLAASKREWRTPPLWGVRDSAPYLHDGRAATLDEAIALHGGEGESSAKRYFALSSAERSRMMVFLNSLAAPK